MNHPDISRIASAAATWPGVNIDRFQHDGTDFLLGRREIGHVHGNDLVDIPFPRQVRDALLTAGRARPHHVFRNSGWVSVPLRSESDVDRAIELLKMSYDLAAAN